MKACLQALVRALSTTKQKRRRFVTVQCSACAKPFGLLDNRTECSGCGGTHCGACRVRGAVGTCRSCHLFEQSVARSPSVVTMAAVLGPCSSLIPSDVMDPHGPKIACPNGSVVRCRKCKKEVCEGHAGVTKSFEEVKIPCRICKKASCDGCVELKRTGPRELTGDCWECHYLHRHREWKEQGIPGCLETVGGHHKKCQKPALSKCSQCDLPLCTLHSWSVAASVLDGAQLCRRCTPAK